MILKNLYNFFFQKTSANNIWQKQLFRKYLLNTKNIFFNEFILENLLPKNWLLLDKIKNNNNSDIILDNLSLLNVDLWSNYIMLWRYEEQQRLLDNAFKKSRYFKTLDDLSNIYNKDSKVLAKKFKKNNLSSDLSLWYQLGYSMDYLNNLNSKINLKDYLLENRSTILLEDSIEYQHKLNIHLVGILDNLSNLYEKDVYIQSKTLRGIFFRFFREICYPWFSAIILTFMSFFLILSELLYLVTSLIAIPLLFYLFIYVILTDNIINFDFETAWFQINFFEFLSQYLYFYFPKLELLLDYDISIYFNNFCWLCIYLFFFFMLLFEGAGWMGILATEEDNVGQYAYSDEGTMYEDIHDSCNLRVFELLLDLSDHDFTNTDYNNYYIFSENSDEFRNLESGFSDLNQFAVQLFTGGIGILYMMQTVIQQDDIEDNELNDLYYYDGLPRHNQEYDDDAEFDFGSSLSYLQESDSSFGLYEYPLDSINIQITQYGSDYNFFDEEGANIEAFIAMPAYGFDIFSDVSINYFLEFTLGNSLFDIFLFIIIFFYCLLYFKLYYDWEIWVYREYLAREYFNRITYLGWQHSLSNEEVISDEDIINNATIIEQNSFTVSGNEQLNFSRDYNPIITDIEYFFEDIEAIIDLKNEYLREDDLEFIEQDEFLAIDDILEDDDLDDINIALDLDNINITSDGNEHNYIKSKSDLVQEDLFLHKHIMNSDTGELDYTKDLNYILFTNFKNLQLLLKNNITINSFFQNIFEFSNLFIFLYKNINKISNPVLKYSILRLLYLYINLKKKTLIHLNYNMQNYSSLDILYLKLQIKNINSTNIVFEIENEVIDLLVTNQLQNDLFYFFDSFAEIEFFDLENEEFYELLSENTYTDDNYYLKNFLINLNILLKEQNKKKTFFIDFFPSISFYPQFFQSNIIGNDNILILDEENDLQFFSLDFEDNIEYFNVDTMDVDLVNNKLIDQDDLYFYDNDNEEDDLSPDTVYNDDENPYDLFSYDLYFYKMKNFIVNSKITENNNLNFIFLKSDFNESFNLHTTNTNYYYKNYIQQFNNFFLYSWSELIFENAIKPVDTLYNVTSITDIEFDTNYIEVLDDELYDDEKFLVPSQRILLHSFINNFRYENISWLDGWGTWHFLNINKFEGTLNTFFHYDIFHADDDYDTDEEDMIEMNMTFFSDTLGEMYNDNLLDENSEFLDGIPDFSSILDDLDGYEEDLLETSYLVDKPYVFVVILILLFECLTIFFIEYYFILFVFLEPENGDNFFSDLIDYRYTGVFFDILKLKSYSIYLFIYNYLTFENNIINEINTYQLIYYSVFCFIDESSGISSVRDAFLQQGYQQSFMLYFLSLYESFVSLIMNYFYTNNEISDEDLGIKSVSETYYEAYVLETKNMEEKYKNYFFYFIHSIVEIVVDFYDTIIYLIRKLICYFYYLKILSLFLKLIVLELIYYSFICFTLVPDFLIYCFYLIINYLLIEEIISFYPNFSFFFNYYISYIFIFFWRFNFLIVLYFDYFFYLLVNFFYLTLFDSLNLQLLALYDFTINYKFDFKFLYFFKPNLYIQSFQYSENLLVKNVTLINKNIEFVLDNLTFIYIQFIIALAKLRIIIGSFFNNCIDLSLINSFEIYIYLFAIIFELDINNYLQIFNLLFYYSIVGIYNILLFILTLSKVYNYDIYLIYIFIFIYYFFCFIYNIYHQTDYNLEKYTINRFQQFDDKYYYNRETINLNPEILYDIETLTFFNNSIDCYLYWL